jgi:hypothetical protein
VHVYHIHLRDSARPRVVHIYDARDAFKEQEHPRDPKGKFAKKGAISPVAKIPLKVHGFQPKAFSQEAHYEHPSGHTVSFHAPPPGQNLTSSFTHYPPGSNGKGTHGHGGKALHQLLSSLNLGVGGTQAKAPAAAAATAASFLPGEAPAGPVKVGSLEKIAPAKGSNPGGVYRDPASGREYYVKHTASAAHAQNERLAASLYKLAGAGTLQYRESDDPTAVVTDMVPLQKAKATDLSPGERKEARLDFAVHAWLANWDAVGLEHDNIGVDKGGKVLNLDMGGALLYRAKGGLKGAAFGHEANEWDSMRDPAKNPQAASLFGDMTSGELRQSADRLKAVGPFAVANLVTAAGYKGSEATELTTKLEARRQAILMRAEQQVDVPFAPSHKHRVGALSDAAPSFLSGAERSAVKSYTGGGFQPINRALRFGYIAGEHGAADKIRYITKWLDRASLPEEVVVTRKVSSDYAQFLKEVAEGGPGATWADSAFAATSANRSEERR